MYGKRLIASLMSSYATFSIFVLYPLSLLVVDLGRYDVCIFPIFHMIGGNRIRYGADDSRI